MRSLIRLLTAALLGVGAAVLVSCGSSGKGLIPLAYAGPLQTDFQAVLQAAQEGDGSCTATEAAIRKTEHDLQALPSSVDDGLRGRLAEGVANLSVRARELLRGSRSRRPRRRARRPQTSPPATSTATTPTAPHRQHATTPDDRHATTAHQHLAARRRRRRHAGAGRRQRTKASRGDVESGGGQASRRRHRTRARRRQRAGRRHRRHRGRPSERRRDRRALPPREPARLRRHVDRAPRLRRAPRAPRRGQAARRAPRRGPDVRLALPARGAGGGAPDPPQHRAGLRLGARRAHATSTSS